MGDRIAVMNKGCVMQVKSSALAIGKAKVDRIEGLGHEALILLTTAKGGSLTARASGERRSEIVAGQETPLAIRADRLHAFDSETGERLA